MTDDELALVARMAFYDATKHSADPWPAIAVAIRAKVIEECAGVAKTAWLTCEYGEIADADAMCALSEHTESAIRALGEKK